MTTLAQPKQTTGDGTLRVCEGLERPVRGAGQRHEWEVTVFGNGYELARCVNCNAIRQADRKNGPCPRPLSFSFDLPLTAKGLMTGAARN